MKKLWMKTAVLFFAMVLVCGMETRVNAKVKVSGVSVKSVVGNAKVVYVAKGKKVKLSTAVRVKPNKSKFKKVKYKISKKKVAMISSKGVIKGKKLGTTKITVVSNTNKKKKATIKVRVVNPVKKVTLSQKAVSLCVDESRKLSAKVIGTKKSNYCKLLKWTSSNRKVVTVSSSGAVKAVGIGSATITAKAIDGSGKYARCKVTASARKTSILTVSYRNYMGREYTNTMYVSLNQPKALSAADFRVMVKTSAGASYTKEMPLEDVSTVNNRDYIITLNRNINGGYYGKVTIDSLNGVKSMERGFVPQKGYFNNVLKGNVGSYMSTSVGSYNSTAKLVSGTLPAGLVYDSKTGFIYGVPTQVADNVKCIFIETNQYGYEKEHDLTFVIGDANHIVTSKAIFGNISYLPFLPNSTLNTYVVAGGGSGNYTYEMVNDCGGLFSLDATNGLVKIKKHPLAAGTYYPVFRVVDKNNASLSAECTWTLIVTQSANVTVELSNYQEVNTEISMKNILNDNVTTYVFSGTNVRSDRDVAPGTYDLYYQTKTENGENKCIYLARNVVINQNTVLHYSVTNNYTITYQIYDSNQTLCSGKNYLITLFGANGKVVVSKLKSDTINFTNIQAGTYYICVFNKDNNMLLGKTNLFTLSGNQTVQISLQK